MSIVELTKKVQPAFASAARSAGSAQLSSEIPVDGYAVVSMLVDFTATSGTPVSTALDAKIQYSPDVSGSLWYDLDDGAITQLTSTGNDKVVNKPITFARRIRVSYTLAFSGGTSPTATFSVYTALTNIGTSEVTLDTGDMSIGAVELKDATASTRAKVVAGTSAAEGDNAVVTKDASVGLKADTAQTDATQSATLIAFMKGAVKVLADVWDSVNHRMKVDGSGVTQPVSAAALPLPTGASTSAKQDTGNTSLASIDTKIPASPATTGKQDTGNTSLGNIDTNAGVTTDAAVTTDANGTLSAKLRGLVKIFNDIWDSTNHFFKVKEQYQPGYEINSGTSPYARTRQTCSALNISADTAVLSGAGFFYGFVCNSTSTGTVKFYDNTAASGTVILNTFTPAAAGVYVFPAITVGTGIYADITNTLDITVLYAAS
jgi:hypothetical protein